MTIPYYPNPKYEARLAAIARGEVPAKVPEKTVKIALDCVHLDDALNYPNPDKPARAYRECLAGHGMKCGCESGQKCSPQECGDYERKAP